MNSYFFFFLQMNGDDEEESNDDLTRNNSYQFVTRGGQDNGCNMLQFEF